MEEGPELRVNFGGDKGNMVGWWEKIHLVFWFITLAVTQLWNDLLAHRYLLWQMPMSDLITRLFVRTCLATSQEEDGD